MFPDDAKQRKLLKYGFAEKGAFVTPLNPHNSPQRSSNVGGSENLASYGNRHFVLQDQRVVDSSETSWTNETVLIGPNHLEEFDVSADTEKGPGSSRTTNFLRLSHELLFQ